MNEILLIGSIFIIFGSVLLTYKIFGEEGLLCFTVLATIAANIEVLITVEAFGMEMTLGNVLFASTFLVTDILCETSGKEKAVKAVNIGIITSVLFIIFSQWWLLYTPGSNDWAMPSMKTIFSNTPRTMLAGLIVYAVIQKFDVWAYHKWWEFTSKKFGSRRKFLWLRNNGSTMLSQLLNAVLFTWGAFGGMYDTKTLISIAVSSYIIFWVTSITDTPFVYAARKINDEMVTK
ncbi:MAG: queuosine precursor transporter [Eubacterium sp.]